jgi:hypothetical protein
VRNTAEGLDCAMHQGTAAPHDLQVLDDSNDRHCFGGADALRQAKCTGC